MNGHGGNDFKPMIREIQPQFPEMLISLVEWFKILNLSEYFEEEGDHAGEMETSVIQFLFPDLVLPLDESGDGKSKKFKLEGLNKKAAWTPRNWSKVSEDTGIGNPKQATPEKGEKYLEEVTDIISRFLVELSTCDINDLYE